MPRFDKNIPQEERLKRSEAQLKKHKNARLTVFLTSHQSVRNWRRISWLILQADTAKNYKDKTAFLNKIGSLEFEHYCAYLLTLHGWQLEYINKSESHEYDGGVDAVLVQNHTKIFIQCKKHNAPKIKLKSKKYPIIEVQKDNIRRFIRAANSRPVSTVFPKKENVYTYDFHYLYATTGYIASDIYKTLREKGNQRGDGFVRLWSLGAFKKIPEVVDLAQEYQSNLTYRIHPIRATSVFIGSCLVFGLMQIFVPFTGIIHITIIACILVGLIFSAIKRSMPILEISCAVLAAQVFFLGILLI